MKKQRLMYAAAFFSLFTFVGHSIGVVSNRALDEMPASATYKIMQLTSVNFPMGFTRDIATLMTGSNLCLSVYLLIAALICILFARNPVWSSRDNQVVLVNACGLVLTGIISAFCFFPVPAISLLLAAALSSAAVFSKS
ncbi:MAG: hypothetical protein K0R29_2004 [Pseudobdellovibrio sp.]|jgi:hypothetical protein|nr:hypothetical protein [Pseudobdellovibrio sp.]